MFLAQQLYKYFSIQFDSVVRNHLCKFGSPGYHFCQIIFNCFKNAVSGKKMFIVNLATKGHILW